MPKFIIFAADDVEIIEAKSLTVAEDIAFETWLQHVDHDYSAEPYTLERAKELGLTDDEEETDHD
jgi:hypothetical protein